MVGVVEGAKLPKSGRLTHFKTMPQAAGKNIDGRHLFLVALSNIRFPPE